MSEYIVSARKYRPDTFSSVVGQENITRTLKNAIKTNQLAQAYLFAGPRGVGKTTTARIFAKTINCNHITDDIEACNNCESCLAFNNNASYNIHELDAASNNSVEDIRNLIEQVRIPPQIGQYKIYIIDEVHMLSQQAFNAFLKTLEEPPKHAIFILATTEKHKIIPTILSRCQIFDFSRITIPQMTSHLKQIAQQEQVTFEDEALNIIAQKADGGLRDALSIFDKLVSFTGGNITYQSVLTNLNVLDYDYYFELTTAFYSGDYAKALNILNNILDKGFSEQNFLGGLLKHFRDLLMLQNEETKTLLEVGDKIKVKYLEQAKQVEVHFLLNAMKKINTYLINLKTTLDKRLHTELLMVELSTWTNESENDATVSKPGKLKLQKTVSSTTENKSRSDQKVTILPKNDENEHKISEESKKEVKKEEHISTKSTTSLAGEKTASSLMSGLNIGQALNKTDAEKQQKKQQEAQIKENLKTSFTQDELLNVWNWYASEYLKENERLVYLFKHHKPQLKDENSFKLELKLVNDSQKQQIESIYKNLISVLKKKLKNTEISMDITVVNEEKSQADVPYTSTEKYQYLKKQNPKIDLLRKNLELDFE